MIARLSLFALLVVATNSIPTNNLNTVTTSEFPTFEEFAAMYNKQYLPQEVAFRKALYEQSVAAIKKHNAGDSTHRKGVTKFADYTPAEFSRMFGYSKDMGRDRRALRSTAKTQEVRSEYFLNRTRAGDLPTSVDWVTAGATSPVKNQGHCGSCWAFAGTEALESDVFLETGQLFILAPQAYVDCVQNPNHCGGTGGCDGATCDLLFDYAVTHGATLEADYPYVANQNQCQNYIPQVSIQAWIDVPPNNETALMAAVVKQPITISVAASNWALYTGGVFSYTECDTDINHAVLLVGYGTDPKFGNYWKVQNSWGPDWGEQGFIRLQRSTDCAIDKTPSHGTGCAGGPPEITVCGTCGMLSDSVYPTGGSIVSKSH